MAVCVVTGGAGFIGAHLVEALVANGHTVRVLDNLSAGSLEDPENIREQVDLVPAIRTHAPFVQRAIKGAELIFHQSTAAFSSSDVDQFLTAHQACGTDTLLLLLAARAEGVRRVVYASSSGVYGSPPNVPATESDPLQPVFPGAAAQLAGEQYCEFFTRTYGLETVRLRYFNVFGPGQSPDGVGAGVIPAFIQAALSGQRPAIYGDGLQSRDFTFLGDVIQANLLAAEAPRASGRVYNIAFGRRTTVRELIECLEKLVGHPIQPIHKAPRPGDALHVLADTSLAQKELGYCPCTDLEEGLKRCLEYYQVRLRRPKAQLLPDAGLSLEPYVKAAGKNDAQVFSES